MPESRLTFELFGRDKASPVFDKFGRRVEDASRKVGLLERTSRTATPAVAALGTLGLGKVLTDSVKLEAQYDKTMRLVAVATDAPKKSLAELDKLAMKMGADTVFSAQDAGAAMLELAKGGLTEAEIRGGALANTLTLASAGGLELGDAANVVVQAMGAFQLSAEDTGAAVAALGGAANASSADVSDITQALSQSATSASAMGLSIQDTTAFLAMFADQGIKGSDAGTGLRTMLTRLVPQTDKAAAAMDSLNLSYTDANGQIVSAEEIAKRTQKAFKGLSDEERTRAINTIFGADAQRAANVLIDKGEAGLRKYKKSTSDLSQAQKLADASMTGTSGALEQLSGSWETAQIQIGKGLAPAVQDLADKASEMVADGDFEKFGERTGEVLTDLGEVAIPLAEDVLPAMGSALSAAASGAQALAPAVKAVAEAFGAMPEWAQTVIVGGWAVNKATGGNLIPPIIAAPRNQAPGRGPSAPVVVPGGGSPKSGAPKGSPRGGPGVGNLLGVIGVAGTLGQMYQDKLLDSLNDKQEQARRGTKLTNEEMKEQVELSKEIFGEDLSNRGGTRKFERGARDAKDLTDMLLGTRTAADDLGVGMAELGRRNAKPKVGLLGVPKALGDLGEVFGDLTKVDRKDPKPTVKPGGIGAALRGLASVGDDLAALDRKTAQPRVRVDTSGAEGAVRYVQRLINSVTGKTVGIRVAGTGGGGTQTARAEGGALVGQGGPREDNLLFWGSNNEHVLDDGDVRAMGGQAGVYAFRRALHDPSHRSPLVGSGQASSSGLASTAQLERLLAEQNSILRGSLLRGSTSLRAASMGAR